jgi:hypothetical protein
VADHREGEELPARACRSASFRSARTTLSVPTNCTITWSPRCSPEDVDPEEEARAVDRQFRRGIEAMPGGLGLSAAPGRNHRSRARSGCKGGHPPRANGYQAAAAAAGAPLKGSTGWSVVPHHEFEVGEIGVAGKADLAQPLTGLDRLARLHGDAALLQMAVLRDQPSP